MSVMPTPNRSLRRGICIRTASMSRHCQVKDLQPAPHSPNAAQEEHLTRIAFPSIAPQRPRYLDAGAADIWRKTTPTVHIYGMHAAFAISILAARSVWPPDLFHVFAMP